MTGAECLLHTLAANRIDVCFMNPGTSEMHFVAGLDHVTGLRGILCLYEGVCSGAADGYARMHGSPAAALLHLGPGLANSLSNLHNARKARSPMVCIVGEHATWHRKVDAPLSSDIAAFARTVSHHVRTVETSAELGPAVSEAIAAALAPPGQIATLIVPADLSWLPAGPPGPTIDRPTRAMPPTENIRDSARILRSAGSASALLLGGASALERGLYAAGRVAKTGVRVFIDRSAPCLASGRGIFPAPKVPYFPEDAAAELAGLTHLILVEADAPVSFFGYPNTPSSPVPDGCAVSVLAAREEDGTAALEALAEEFGSEEIKVLKYSTAIGGAETGALTIDAIGVTLAALLPESAIVSDEMISVSARILTHLDYAAPHVQLPITGGAIGQGLPVAVGAAVACPDRKVVALQADGSAMYSLQALWTMARENLDVAVVIFSNRRYRILDIEMRRTAAPPIGPRADAMLDLRRPDLDFASLAQGMGVPATRATTTEEFTCQFRAAMSERGPRLIEAVLN